MQKSDTELHKDCVNRFIELANTMKNEGVDTNLVSGGLMTASGLYASFVAGGNQGGLTESGIDKVVSVFRRELERVEKHKKKDSGQ